MKNDKTAEARISEYRDFVRNNNITYGDAYQKLHEIFPEDDPIKRRQFYEVCTTDELFLYNH